MQNITVSLCGLGSVLDIPRARPKTSHEARTQHTLRSTPLIDCVLNMSLYMRSVATPDSDFKTHGRIPRLLLLSEHSSSNRGSEPYVSPLGFRASMLHFLLVCFCAIHATLLCC